jgi:hypothetical protein
MIDSTWTTVGSVNNRDWAIDIEDLFYNYEDVYKDDPDIIYVYQNEDNDNYSFKFFNRGLQYTYPVTNNYEYRSLLNSA